MDESEEYGELLDLLKFCGCGCPEEAITYLGTILEAVEARSVSEWKVNDVHQSVNLPDEHPAYWIVWYHLDSCDLIEHGGNVTGSWLTATGERALQLYRTWKDQPTREGREG